MASIIDYLKWRGDLTFEQSEFNEVDALLLCEIIYANFNGIISEDFNSGISLREAASEFVNSADFKKRKKSGMFINPLVIPLLQLAGESRRFGSLVLSGFREKLDYEEQEQFAAMTVQISKNSYAVVFRGTDDNLVGFAEDANLGLQRPIPSQIEAIKYISSLMLEKKGKFILTGHSKGGNVAFFAARNIDSACQKKIKSVYLFDSPGFGEEFFTGKKYDAIKDIVNLYVPSFSIVGMIFNNPKNYTVVANDKWGIEQHDPFSWNCIGCGFEEVDDVCNESKFFNATMNSWYNELSIGQRKIAIDTYNKILRETDAKTNTELAENKLDSIIKLLKAVKNLDGKTKIIFFRILRLLSKYANNNAFILWRKHNGRNNHS